MKADELWENYARNGLTEIGKVDFLAALQEYGELVKAEAVKVCKGIQLGWSSDDHLECADAIEKMKLP